MGFSNKTWWNTWKHIIKCSPGILLIQWTFSLFSFPWLILNLGNSITSKRQSISCYTVSNEGKLSFTLETCICIFLEIFFLLLSLYVSHRYVFVKINAIENIITIPRRRWNLLNWFCMSFVWIERHVKAFPTNELVSSEFIPCVVVLVVMRCLPWIRKILKPQIIW